MQETMYRSWKMQWRLLHTSNQQFCWLKARPSRKAKNPADEGQPFGPSELRCVTNADDMISLDCVARRALLG